MTTWQYIALGTVAVLLYIGATIFAGLADEMLQAVKPLWLNYLIYGGLILFIICGTWYAVNIF
ncbi:hypothetical protein [Gimesia aquarii]|uniref:Uncharacterized protein n=1 Tax=Gimesia aquarii TaxID=2527964 RepID=A0A517VRK4_9PLAN|nr:hypothetical protein [Gimesia aquarii]QDT95643.1 hypothetical protein V144x_10890 [Gimesia aquarii]